MKLLRRHDMPPALTDFEDRFMNQMRGEGLSTETIRQRVYLLRGLGGEPWRVIAMM